LVDICRRSGATRSDEHLLSLQYLGHEISINLERCEFFDSDQELSSADRLIILHYLAGAGPVCTEGSLITFKELAGGLVYYPSFEKRAISPLLAVFGEEASGLAEAGHRLGAVETGQGDFGIQIPVLPKISVNLALWQADGELPASGTYYFADSIGAYLPTEDVAVLCQSITGRLTGCL
jgi:hypothetical protein